MKKVLAKIYTYTFLTDFVLIYPLYTVMFSDFGMSAWKISILLAVWSATTFILEIPSGVWADKYSRKKILFAGQCIRSTAFLVWIIFPGFTGFLIGFVLWGIESALSSGTFEALIFDELKNFNQQKQFTKIYGRTRTISFAAILSASLIASPAILAGYGFILISSCISVLLSALIISSLPTTEKFEQTGQTGYFTILKKGLNNALKSKAIVRILFFSTLTFAFSGVLEEFYGIFAKSAGLPAFGVGVFIAFISGMEGCSSFVAYRFEKLKTRWIYALFIFGGLLLCLAGYIFSVPTSLLLIILFALPNGIVQTIFEGKLQHSIPSETRATISSVKGFFIETEALVFYFSIGYITQKGGYNISFIIFGLIMILVGSIYLITLKKENSGKIS